MYTLLGRAFHHVIVPTELKSSRRVVLALGRSSIDRVGRSRRHPQPEAVL